MAAVVWTRQGHRDCSMHAMLALPPVRPRPRYVMHNVALLSGVGECGRGV